MLQEVGLELGRLDEALGAVRAHVRFGARVRQQVPVQRLLGAETSVALSNHTRPSSRSSLIKLGPTSNQKLGNIKSN